MVSSGEVCSSSSSSGQQTEDPFLLVSSPIVVIVDKVATREELRSLLVERAAQMGIPVHQIVRSGLFRVFRGEVRLSETSPSIEFET